MLGAGDVRAYGPRARRDQDVPGRDALTVELDTVRLDDSRGAVQQRGASLLERGAVRALEPQDLPVFVRYELLPREHRLSD